MSQTPPHLIILGGGTAAITAAYEMAVRGGKVTLIHEGLPVGGCCLHVGCVPSKYWIRAAEQVHTCRHSHFPGLAPQGVEVNQSELFKDLHQTIARLRERNYEPMLRKLDKVTAIRGWGRIEDGTTVSVNGNRIPGDAILIATGSRTDLTPAKGLSDELVLSNENLFHQEQLPESVLVVGGGYIAVELSQMMNRFGVEVTTLQRSQHILSSQPEVMGSLLGNIFREEGVQLKCGVDVKELREGGKGVEAVTEVEGEQKIFTAEKVLMARGRLGNTQNLNLESIPVSPQKNGYLDVNETFQTSCPTVYAVGDVLGGHMLVYTASKEAEQMVAGFYDEQIHPLSPESVPWVVFSDPQAAGVGWSMEEAKEQGIEAEEAELPVNRWPRFSTIHESTGFLKLIRDVKTDQLVGARAVCPEAGDLMSELALIRDEQIPLKTIANRVVPYLTLTEGIQLCAAKFQD